jgi:L-threonylcarbamoyladenylate synthase
VSHFFNEFEGEIVELLQNGAVGLLPTDTIYGLSALALNEQAVERIHKLKHRDDGKPLVVLISNIKQLAELGLSVADAEHVKNYWPAPLSVEFDATNAPEWLHRGKFYFGVRMPDNDSLRSFIRKVGPIVSSSANLQGQRPASSVREAKNYFGNKLDFYVDQGNLEGRPSTLVKIKDGRITVLRQGALKIEA